MANFVILLKKNILEMIRNKRILIFGIVFMAISVISALSARYLPDLINALLESMEEQIGGTFLVSASVAESYVQFISNIGEIAVLLVGILFAVTISKEKSRGTYNDLVTRGVKDRDIVLAHFASQVIVITVCYLLSIAVFVTLNVLLFNQIMGIRGVVALLYLYLLLIATMSFTLLVSSVCNKNSRAYLFVILGYFGLTFLEAIPKLNKFNPFHLLTLGSELMYYTDYAVGEHLLTSLFTLLVSGGLVVLALYLSKNRVNNCNKVDQYDHTERV